MLDTVQSPKLIHLLMLIAIISIAIIIIGIDSYVYSY